MMFCLVINFFWSKPYRIPKMSLVWATIISLIALLGIVNCPGGYGSDKERYEAMFLNAQNLVFEKDIAWMYYTKFLSTLGFNTWFYFFTTALVYLGSYWLFAKKNFSEDYMSYFMILSVGSMGFYSYGMNTIRAGFALGLLLIALLCRKKIIFFALFSFLAICFHKSMIIPILSFIICFFYKKTKFFLFFWFAMLVLSILNISVLSTAIQNIFAGSDERVVGYMSLSYSDLYQAGFRWDFILYSLFPILVGYFYVFLRKFNDVFYIQVFNTYLLTNAFWLIIVRIPFTDRFAYLSWFLIPFILLYPLVREPILRNQQLLVSGIIFVMVFVNFLLSVV